MNNENNLNEKELETKNEDVKTPDSGKTQEVLGLGEIPQNSKPSEEDFSDLFGQPEVYDYCDVELPENMILDEVKTAEFSDYAKKLNLSQKGANSIMKMAVALTKQTQEKTLEAMRDMNIQKILNYKKELVEDREIGGYKLNSAIETANTAYDGFFKDEELRALLAESGLSVHPKFIKALKAIGEQMREDSIYSSNNAEPQQKSREEILYSSMKD